MATEDDDDPARDWPQDAVPKTTVDPPTSLPADETPTAPHRTLAVDQAFEAGREAGFRAGYPEGQENAIEALLAVFEASPGGVDEFAAAVVARVRSKLTTL